MDIEIIIDQAIEDAQAQGIQIVSHVWGIQNIDGKWKLNRNECCPLGATLLKHNLTFPAEHFLYVPKAIDLRDVRFNPTYSITQLFNVDIEWVNSFIHGVQDMKIGYFANLSARNLGFKYNQQITHQIV